MAKNIIDPVGRMEGHMAVDLTIDDLGLTGFATDPSTPTAGPIDDASVSGTMYRGFENIMLDRQPQEGIQITQRI